MAARQRKPLRAATQWHWIGRSCEYGLQRSFGRLLPRAPNRRRPRRFQTRPWSARDRALPPRRTDQLRFDSLHSLLGLPLQQSLGSRSLSSLVPDAGQQPADRAAGGTHCAKRQPGCRGSSVIPGVVDVPVTGIIDADLRIVKFPGPRCRRWLFAGLGVFCSAANMAVVGGTRAGDRYP